MSRKKLPEKEGFFSEEMGRNIFVFDTNNKQPYLRPGERRKVDLGKIYRLNNPSSRNRPLSGRLRFN